MKDLANNDIYRLRSYSSVFSRCAFTDILQFDDYYRIDHIINKFDSASAYTSYFEYLKKIYFNLSKYYRCEYVYKNEMIRNVIPALKKEKGSHKTVIFNEFKVGDSIADIVFFNGESKAFEIKTDLDTPKRLHKQIEDYKKLFDKSYIVVPTSQAQQYLDIIEQETGVILLSREKGRIRLNVEREAIKNDSIDVNILMQCLRSEEYKRLVSTEKGQLPNVPEYEMYDACLEEMETIPISRLKELFLEVIKHRKNNTPFLKDVPFEFRQICLSLGLNQREINLLFDKLNKQLN